MAEILAPAGNMDSFLAAAEAGADAVYLAMPRFGARAYARNFDQDSLQSVLAKAHVLGMKVYVTMNTILYEDEMEAAYEQAKWLHQQGVDALIVQDLGLMHLLKHRLPDLEVHASTQLSVSRKEQLEQLKKLGIKRTVLARECTLDQIRELGTVPDMEIEVFVHGALCISYSGQCRFSQVRMNRSGNRGACAQFCRMEYELECDGRPVRTDGSYLLSPRDISVFPEIGELEKAGVDSLKIEGRMKSPVYVYESVRHAKERKGPDRNLRTAFNRTYSNGHLHEQEASNLMNHAACSHQGVEIGTVVSAGKERADIRLTAPLYQEDGIRFVWKDGSAGVHANFLYDKSGRFVKEGKAGEIIGVPVRAYVPKGARVFKTLDARHTAEVAKVCETGGRKRTVQIELSGTAGSPLVLTMQAGQTNVSVETEPASPARKPMDKERMKSALAKLGDTPFQAGTIRLDLDGEVFIPAKSLNEARRQAAALLEEKLTRPADITERSYDFQVQASPGWKEIALVQKADQVVDQNHIWVSGFDFPGTEKKASITEEEGYLTAHLGKGKILSDMNITNSWGIAAALEMGYEGVILSGELSPEQVKAVAEGWTSRYGGPVPAIVPVYGKPRLMLMKHCPIENGLGHGCGKCRRHRYELKGKDGRKVWMYGDAQCNMQLFDDLLVDNRDQIPVWKGLGLAGILYAFTDESPDEVRSVM